MEKIIEAIAYNGASIIAQRGQITNPRVIYKTSSAEKHNGHMNLFQSEAAIQYINQKNQEYQALLDRYDGTIPDSVKAEFYAGVNRFQTSEPDADFMKEINSFFESSLLDQENIKLYAGQHRGEEKSAGQRSVRTLFAGWR